MTARRVITKKRTLGRVFECAILVRYAQIAEQHNSVRQTKD